MSSHTAARTRGILRETEKERVRGEPKASPLSQASPPPNTWTKVITMPDSNTVSSLSPLPPSQSSSDTFTSTFQSHGNMTAQFSSRKGRGQTSKQPNTHSTGFLLLEIQKHFEIPNTWCPDALRLSPFLWFILSQVSQIHVGFFLRVITESRVTFSSKFPGPYTTAFS